MPAVFLLGTPLSGAARRVSLHRGVFRILGNVPATTAVALHAGMATVVLTSQQEL